MTDLSVPLRRRLKGTERYRKVQKGTERYRKVQKGTEWYKMTERYPCKNS